MKNLIQIVSMAALVALGSFNLRAADTYGVDTVVGPSGFTHQSWTTNTGPIAILGSMVSNFTGNAAVILPVPANGFGLYMRTGGTNSSDTTNLTVVLEGVIFPTAVRSAGTQVVDNATYSVVTPTTATALPTGYDYLTNFFNNSAILAEGKQLSRCDGVRIRSIQNTNVNTIWISNLFQIR